MLRRSTNKNAVVFVTLVFGLVMVSTCERRSTPADKEQMRSQEQSCEHGINPHGNGCAVLCDDSAGWHLGPTGNCILNCLPMTAPQEDGSCGLACSPEETLTKTTINTSTGIRVVRTCDPGCPEHMALVNGQCEIPCGEGWERGASGKCRLSCPEGMTPSQDARGCTFVSVGENKVCPDTPWDTAISGPSPLFVDAVHGAATGNGTPASPFATIGQAVAVMEEEATVYLAPGVYEEQVFVENKKTFNLIGHCASDTIVVPAGLTFPTTEQGASAGAVTTWWVDNVRIHGITVSSPGIHGIVVRHNNDTNAVLPQNVQVDQVVVNDADEIAVLVRGRFPQVMVKDTTVTKGQTGIYVVSDDTQSMASSIMQGTTVARGEVHILGNHIAGLTMHNASFNVEGIYVAAADTATISGNRVENLSHGTGMSTGLVNTVILEKNIISDIEGYGAVSLSGDLKEGFMTTARVEDNIIYNISAGPCPSSAICGDLAVGIDFLSAKQQIAATLRRNRIEKVQGPGINLSSNQEEQSAVDITNSQFVACSSGVSWSSGAVTISDSRFYRTWNAVLGSSLEDGVPNGHLILQNNTLEDRAFDPARMPAAFRDSFSSTVVYLADMVNHADITIAGNLFRNNRQFESEPILFLLGIGGDTVYLADNVFQGNDGISVFIDSGQPEVVNNLFIENETGLWIGSSLSRIPSAQIKENRFFSNQTGLEVTWLDADAGQYIIDDNVFVNTDILLGLDVEKSIPSQKLQLSANHFNSAFIYAGTSKVIEMKENLLEKSLVMIASQPVGSSTQIVGNQFQESHVDLYQLSSTVHFSDNALTGPSPFFKLKGGLVIYDCIGPIYLNHNLIQHYAFIENIGLASFVSGDGIQVVGIPEHGITDVWISDNRIGYNGRYGISLSSAQAFLDGNMYYQNGVDSGSDVMIYNPVGTGCHGKDSSFSTVTDTPFSVVCSDAFFETQGEVNKWTTQR